MPFISLKLPPGIYRPGTVYDARGRWYDANLVRWHENAMQAVGGWQAVEQTTPTPGEIDVNERVCGLIAWRANDETAQLAFGTPSALYTFSGGALAEVTPTGFTPGAADASMATALYGAGPYGAGVYGTGDPAQGALVEAQNWSLDTYGEDLVALAYSDRKLYYWDKSVGGDATELTNAPAQALGVVVTPERFIVAVGAEGDSRKVMWPDQDDPTDWTPTSTNQAGDYTLPGVGQLMCGRRARTETLLWTDSDLFAMRYIGGDLIYSFKQEGSACGLVGRRAEALVDGKALWMGYNAFYVYDGFVRVLPCDVGDHVFRDINRVQLSKVWADVRSGFSEVTWHYPSSGSSECDRYVTYNYAANIWSIGRLERTAGVDRGAFPYPIMADASGHLYQHETGTEYITPTGGELVPYAESGPVEIAEGDSVMHVTQVVPDERTLGGVALSLVVAMYPTAPETVHGPYVMNNPTSVRVTARQMRLRAEQVDTGWRLGTPRLEVKAGGRR